MGLRRFVWMGAAAAAAAAWPDAGCGLATDTGSSAAGGSKGTGGASSTGGGQFVTGSGGEGGRGGAGASGGGGAGGGATGAGGGGGAGGRGVTTGVGGGAPCHPSDPGGVCCPNDECGQKCCHVAGAVTCQSGTCSAMTHYDCDDSRDCASGKVCCATWDPMVQHYVGDIKCVDLAMCPPPGMQGDAGTYEMCDVNLSSCQNGRTCHPSSDLQGEHGFCY